MAIIHTLKIAIPHRKGLQSRESHSSLDKRFDRRNRRSGFSLVELLVVMAIASFLLAMTGLGISGLMSARRLSDTAEGIAGILRTARAQAVANNTYVTVGFRNSTNDGSATLEVGVAHSLDGTEPTVGNVTSQLGASGRLRRFRNVHVQPATISIAPEVKANAGANATNELSTNSAFTYLPHGDFDWRILVTPSGEFTAATNAATLTPGLLIGLAEARSDTVIPVGDLPEAKAAVRVESASGSAEVILP